MNLQNGYKVLYEVAADGKRTFYASKSGTFSDSEVITEAEIGKYRLIYEKAGSIYGSETGIPTENDYFFTAFDSVLKEAVEPAQTYSRRARKTVAKVAVEENVSEVEINN